MLFLGNTPLVPFSDDPQLSQTHRSFNRDPDLLTRSTSVRGYHDIENHRLPADYNLSKLPFNINLALQSFDRKLFLGSLTIVGCLESFVLTRGPTLRASGRIARQNVRTLVLLGTKVVVTPRRNTWCSKCRNRIREILLKLDENVVHQDKFSRVQDIADFRLELRMFYHAYDFGGPGT